jgi:hypothetical protein
MLKKITKGLHRSISLIARMWTDHRQHASAEKLNLDNRAKYFYGSIMRGPKRVVTDLRKIADRGDG